MDLVHCTTLKATLKRPIENIKSSTLHYYTKIVTLESQKHGINLKKTFKIIKPSCYPRTLKTTTKSCH